MAGLALAAELAVPECAHLRVLLLDKRVAGDRADKSDTSNLNSAYPRDRTFSYWRLRPHAYTALERKQWHAWRVAVNNAESKAKTAGAQAAAPYCSIDADAFYACALRRINRAAHISLLLGADAVLEPNGALSVNQQSVQAGLIVDARGQAPQAANGAAITKLAQHFEGWEVEVEHAVFTPDTLDLMQFTAVPTAPGMHFMYVLPYSPTRALVESTWVSPAPYTRDYPAEITHYLSSLGAGSVQVHFKERGTLLLNPPPPVASSPVRSNKLARPSKPVANVLLLGSRGGLLRAATGYSFIETLAHCQRIAARLGAQALPLPNAAELAFVRSWQDQRMDEVLFKVLLADWHAAPSYFTALFAKVPPDCLLRFLSGSAEPLDRVRIMLALPKLPFVKALFTKGQRRQAEACKPPKQGEA